MTGCAHAYRVRYSGAAITEADWAHAAEIPRYALPLPRPGGQRQFLHLMTLTRLTVSDPAVKQLQLLLNRYSLGAVYVLPYWTNFGAAPFSASPRHGQ
jgi:hypothetical protein